MDAYKKTLKKRRNILAFLCAISIVLVLAVGIFAPGESAQGAGFMQGATAGFSAGMFTGFILLLAMEIAKCVKALRDEASLRALYIKEQDERLVYIRTKAGGLGYNLALGLCAIAAVIAGLLNAVAVTLTLSAVLVTMALIKGSLKLYYMRRL